MSLPESAHSLSTNDEIDLLEYGRVLWHWRYVTVALSGFLVIVAFVFAMLMKPTYVAEVTLLLEEKNSQAGLGSMMDMASRFGFSVPGASDPTAVFSDILQSRSFLSQYSGVNLPSIQDSNAAPVSEFLGIQTKNPDSLARSISSSLKGMIKFERKDNIAILSVTSADPIFSSALANDVVSRLQKYNKEGWVTKVQKNRVFVEDRLDEIERELRSARERLAAFRERNMRLDVGRAPNLLDQQEGLIEEVKTKQEVYLLLKKEYEMTRIEEEKDRPYIQVLDGAISPEPTYKPDRKLLVAVTLVLSIFLGLLLSFIAEFLVRNQLLPEKFRPILIRIRR